MSADNTSEAGDSAQGLLLSFSLTFDFKALIRSDFVFKMLQLFLELFLLTMDFLSLHVERFFDH